MRISEKKGVSLITMGIKKKSMTFKVQSKMRTKKKTAQPLNDASHIEATIRAEKKERKKEEAYF